MSTKATATKKSAKKTAAEKGAKSTAEEKVAATKKAAPKAAAAEKAAPKKAAVAEKAAPKKAAPKKAAVVEKAAPKKVAPKKAAVAEKAAPKKAAVVEKAAPKKAAPKKAAVVEKAAPKKAAVAEKAAPKKAAPKKAAVAEKAATKKATTKKAATKEVAPKKTAKKAAPEKAATKKAATKKTTAKEAAPEKAAAPQERPLSDLELLAQGLAGPTLKITLLEGIEGIEPGLSRIGGPGFELGERRPHCVGAPMTHVLTLAVDEIPALQAAFPGAAAVALYVGDPGFNQAYSPYNDEAAVVALGADDVARGLAQPTPKDLEPCAIEATTIELPAAAFAEAAPAELREALQGLPARAGGEPLWIQGKEDGGRFLLQFDEQFVPMNLGDAGVMYVFDDTAYWQCH